MLIGPGAVQDGLGIVLVRFFFHLAVRVRFFVPLGLVLGSSWGAFGSVLGRLGVFWPRFGVLRWAFLSVSTSFLSSCFFAFVAAGLAQSVSDNRHYFLSTHLLINSLPINSLTLSSNSSLQSYSCIFLYPLINSSTLIQSTYSSIVLWFSTSMMFVLFPSTHQPSPLL